MRNYELTVLFHPDLEMNLEPALAKVKEILSQNGAKITKEENDGKKRLAYSVEGQEYGIFYFFEAEVPTEAPAKIENSLNLAEEVMRHLLVKVDEKKLKFLKRGGKIKEEEEE